MNWQFVFSLLLGILISTKGSVAQEHSQKPALPSEDEIRELTNKASDKTREFMKALAIAAPFMEKETVSSYSEAATNTELIIKALQKNGPSAYGLVSLLASMDDMALDASRASLSILSKISAGSIQGEENRNRAISGVMVLTDCDKSLSDISELVMHATLRYVNVEENLLSSVLDKAK